MFTYACDVKLQGSTPYLPRRPEGERVEEEIKKNLPKQETAVLHHSALADPLSSYPYAFSFSSSTPAILYDILRRPAAFLASSRRPPFIMPRRPVAPSDSASFIIRAWMHANIAINCSNAAMLNVCVSEPLVASLCFFSPCCIVVLDFSFLHQPSFQRSSADGKTHTVQLSNRRGIICPSVVYSSVLRPTIPLFLPFSLSYFLSHSLVLEHTISPSLYPLSLSVALCFEDALSL